MKNDLPITIPHAAGNGEHPGDPGDPGERPVPWWVAELRESTPLAKVANFPPSDPVPVVNIAVPSLEPPPLLPIAKAEGDCPVCRGPLVAVRTFDGFENLECLPCDRCFGCRRAGAPVERFGNGGGRNRDLFSTTPTGGQA